MKPVDWLKSLENVPQRSPERDALVATINRRHDRLRELNDAKAALSKALNQVTEARGVIARAEAAEAEAEDADVQTLVSGNDASTVEPPDPRAVERARRKFNVAEKASGVLTEKIDEIEGGLPYSGDYIKQARAKFLASSNEVRVLLDERNALFLRLCDMDHALYAVWSAGGLPQVKAFSHVAHSAPAGELAQRWQEAVAALLEDGDAQLPD